MGANIIIDLATNPKYVENSGQYFDNDRGSFGKAHSDAYDQQIIDDVMSETKKTISLVLNYSAALV